MALNQVLLFMLTTLATSVSSSDSDEYIVGPTEDKLLLAFIVVLLVVAAVFLVVAIVVPCIAIRRYKQREAKRLHVTPPATRMVTYSSTYINKTVVDDGTNNGSIREAQRSFNGDAIKINGVVYDNPGATGDAKSYQSFDNPAYEDSAVAVTPARLSADGDSAL